MLGMELSEALGSIPSAAKIKIKIAYSLTHIFPIPWS
jgi:hypothetical protein